MTTSVTFSAGVTPGTADSILYVEAMRTDDEGQTRRATAVLTADEIDSLRRWLSQPHQPSDSMTVRY